MVERKKYLWQHPSGRWYVRVKGQYFRIDANQGTADFDRQYWEVLTGKREMSKRSWSALIEQLLQSAQWAGFSPRYRQDLEPVLQYLDEKIGSRDVSRLAPADIYAAMDRNAHRTRFANYIPTAVSMLSKLAVRQRWRNDNPAQQITKLKVPKERQKPHKPWPDEAVDEMRENGSYAARLIFEIGVGSVQRPSDWLKFRWGDYDGFSLQLSQGKTGIALWLPCTERLKATLNEHRRKLGGAPKPEQTILAKKDGSPMRYHDMERIMRKERIRLGLMDYDQHALRYRGVMELADANCTDDQIASYSGHTTKAMIVKYAGMARQKRRALEASQMRTRHENESQTKQETDTKGDTP